MTELPYQLHLPRCQSTPVVFASPHSGRDYPADFVRAALLDEPALRSSEDAFIDLLFAAAPEQGAPLLCALTPRAYVDLNRSPDEMDPAVITGVRRGVMNPRITSGLGVIPRVVANGRPIYSGKLPMTVARDRIDRFWHPYHARLQSLLGETHQAFGRAILIDCHSMPNEALDSVRVNGQRPDIVLGDRFGASAAADIVAHVQSAFERAGLVVSRNVPFAGAYIVQRYGRPARGQHVIQVEINRALYMDEQRVAPSPAFAELQARMTGVIGDILRDLNQDGQPVAAE